MTQTRIPLHPNHRMRITDGTIVQLNHNPHRAAKNWVATVQRNAEAQGGLSRSFWKRDEEHASVPKWLQQGDYIEMAGDYYARVDQPEYHRIYVRVIEVTPKHIEVVEVKKEAIGHYPNEVEVLESKPETRDRSGMTAQDAKKEVGDLLFRALCLIDAWHLDHAPDTGKVPPKVVWATEGKAIQLVSWAALEFPMA